MQSWISITKFTWLEVMQSKTYMILLGLTLLAPLFGVLLSSLFLVDIGKVYMDGVMGLTHTLSMVFVLFIAGTLLSRDIEQRICYFLLAQPTTRTSYIFGRFTGLLLAFFVLIVLLFLESSLVGHFYIEQKAEMYRSGYAFSSMAGIIFLHAFQYIALLGLIFFIFSWATGISEIMLFSSVGVIFSWAFPPILLAMQNPDVAQLVPSFIQQILNFIYQLLPHLDGASIALALTHGEPLAASAIAIYVVEHIAYAACLLIMATWFFSRRDL